MLNSVIHGDCLDKLRELEDGCIDLVVTDPPFNMDWVGRGKITTFDAFANDNLKEDLHSQFIKDVFTLLYQKMKTDSVAYIFIDFRNYARFYNVLKNIFKIKHCLVWDKMKIGMGQIYRFQHEFIIYAHKGKGKFLNIEKKNVPVEKWDMYASEIQKEVQWMHQRSGKYRWACSLLIPYRPSAYVR